MKLKRGKRASQRTKETFSNMFSLLGSDSALRRLITNIVKRRCNGEVDRTGGKYDESKKD